jgi:hypothetical protein
MKSRKKQVRAAFRLAVFERDGYRCRVCGKQWSPDQADPNQKLVNAHHITDRSEMPNGGYVMENGITVCDVGSFENPSQSCHMRVEQWHITRDDPEWKGGQRVEDGLHPDELYDLIGSSFEQAWEMSEILHHP